MRLERPAGELYYEVLDLTPAWMPDAPLVIFHHGVGATADIWAEWLPALADRYRLARFDTLGFGRSSVPGPRFGWTLDGLADDVVASPARPAPTGSTSSVNRSVAPWLCGSPAGGPTPC
jgi:pimeloyl-ACP methyl ester carboxylesterase